MKIDRFKKDIEKLLSSCKANSVYLFGSTLHGNDTIHSDVDLAILIPSPNIEEIRDIISNLKLELPASIRKINGSYSSAFPEISGKHYHIVILDSDQDNTGFFERSKAKLIMTNK